MNKPRLLYLVSEDWFFCLHWFSFAQAALDAGFQVIVATRIGPDAQRIRDAGFDLVPLHWSRRSVHPLREWRSLRDVVSVFRAVRPDIVHQIAIKPIIYGSIAARLTGVPIIVNAVAGLGYAFSSNDLRARILRPFLRAAFHFLLDRPNARLIVQNRDDADHFVGERMVRRDRVALIRGAGVDPQQFGVVPERDGTPLVVLPARMLRDKGVQEFVAAARSLRQEGVVARFALVGSPDPENPACIPAAQLQAWQDEGVIEYWGWRTDMVTVFQGAHIVCLPSYREGLPKSLIEAAACGRPILTTDVAGCREVVRDGENGFLVPARDAEALAIALRRLVQDRELRARFGRRGREFAERDFATARVVGETLALYRETMREVLRPDVQVPPPGGAEGADRYRG